MNNGCTGQRQVLAAIAACSKPDAAGLQQLVGPVGEQMQKVRLPTTNVHMITMVHMETKPGLLADASF